MKQDIIIFQGKVLECESLFEVRAGTSLSEWKQLVDETVNFYCFMKSAQSISPGKIDKADLRLSRRLKRSIEFIKKLDPSLHIDLDAMCKAQAKHLSEGWEAYQAQMNIVKGNEPNRNADLTISRL